jgi:hypothetical protein
MEEFYRIDEGHEFSLEDGIFYMRWKIEELLQKEHTIESIQTFTDDDFWCCHVQETLNITKR